MNLLLIESAVRTPALEFGGIPSGFGERIRARDLPGGDPPGGVLTDGQFLKYYVSEPCHYLK